MNRRTRRGGRGGGPRTLLTGLVVLTLLGASVAAVTPTQSYTTVHVDRQVSADIVVDEDAILSLDTASSVSTGRTEKLVNVTNYVGQDIDVTIELVDGSSSYGDLVVDGSNVGDSTSFALTTRGSQNLEFSAPCDGSLGGKSVTFDVSLSGDGISGSATRSVDIVAGCDTGVVYATPNSRDLRTVRDGTGITHYDATDVEVISPQSADLDGDGRLETAFINSSDGDIWTVDRANDTTLLLDSGALSDINGAEPAKSRMAVGTWSGSDPSVFFVNDGETAIYRVDDGGITKIVDAPNGAGAVVGVVDIDEDGGTEIVFMDGSAQLRYVEEDGSTIRKISNGGAGSNNGVGVGQPADFDGDGQPRAPFIDGSSYLALVTYDGNKTVLTTNGNNIKVDVTPLAAFDWDGDGRPEIVVVDSGVLHVVDDIGGDVTVTEITKDDSPVSAARETGAA